MQAMKLLVIVCMAIVLVNCGSYTKDKEAADVALANFHRLYNESQNDAIWEQAAQGFRDDKQKFDKFIGAIERKLGKMTSTESRGSNVTHTPQSHIVTLFQYTTFEHGKGTETFRFEVKDEKAFLFGYHVDSPDLVD